MAKSAVKLDIKIESTLLSKKINEFARLEGKKNWDIVKMGVEWFTQSVVKKTPPTGKFMKKRDVISLQTNRYTPKGKGVRRFKVPYRTNKKQGAKYFSKKTEANKFAQIRYRFIGKFGWLAAGESFLNTIIPSRVKSKAGKNAKFLGSVAHRIQSVKKGRFRLKPFVILINKVDNISRYGNFAIAQALRTTKNRFKGAMRAIKKQYVKNI